jgi:hypothetical protein
MKFYKVVFSKTTDFLRLIWFQFVGVASSLAETSSTWILFREQFIWEPVSKISNLLKNYFGLLYNYNW